MCTVKKDLNIPESSLANSVGMIDLPPPAMPAKAPSSAADNYDLINRQQSQLLLDMIYATKKPCFFSTKVPCPGTPAAKAVAEKGLAEELAAIKAELAEVKAQLGALPGAILAAFKEEQQRQMAQVQQKKEDEHDLVEVGDDEIEDSDDDDDEDFDRLSSSSSSTSSSSSSITAASVSTKAPQVCEQHPKPSSPMPMMCHSASSTRTVSMSSDIEVLSSFHHCSGSSGSKPACFGSSANCANSSAALLNSTFLSNSHSSSSPPPAVSISKELAQLSAKLKAMELPLFKPTTTTPFPNNNNDDQGKAIASNIFSHWADRFASSTAKQASSGGAPTGNIVSKVNKASSPSPSPVKILPYSSAIDVNHWLK